MAVGILKQTNSLVSAFNIFSIKLKYFIATFKDLQTNILSITTSILTTSSKTKIYFLMRPICIASRYSPLYTNQIAKWIIKYITKETGI
jgi:hypothetical protein